MRRIALAVSLLVASTLVGCASNPTPHPEADGAAGGAPPTAGSDASIEDPAGEDQDGDAVADVSGDAEPRSPMSDAGPTDDAVGGDAADDSAAYGDVPADVRVDAGAPADGPEVIPPDVLAGEVE